MQQTRIIGTNALLESAKSLLRQGILTKEQVREMERRNNLLPKTARESIIELRRREE